MTKKQKIILFGILFLIAAAGIAHTLAVYLIDLAARAKSPYLFSYPSEVHFLLLIPYALAMALCLAIGLLIIYRKRKQLVVLIAAVIGAIGAFHMIACYMNLLNDPQASVSEITALLWLIPYTIAIAVCLAVGFVLLKRQRKVDCKEETKTHE